jgi:hypothetical protein
MPQALVVAMLAGTGAAGAGGDMTVRLSVDGQPRTVRTAAGDVAGVLREQGLAVGAHDLVAPEPGARVRDGDAVAVRYGRPLTLTLDGRRRRVWTTATTVAGALRQLGVRAQGAVVDVSRSAPIGRRGLALDVRTLRRATVVADGRAHLVRTHALTVRGAVLDAGLLLGPADRLLPAAGTTLEDGVVVRVTRPRPPRPARPHPAVHPARHHAAPAPAHKAAHPAHPAHKAHRKPRAGGGSGPDWRALAACESGGRAHAVDPSGRYGGLYQFDVKTWHSVGGSGRPQDASAAEQTRRARRLYADRGAAPWPVCGVHLRRG